MIFSLFTKKKKNTDYNEMDVFIEKEYCDDVISTTVFSEEEEEEKQENKDGVIKKARDLLKDAIKIFT
jgi:hypothetical protein